VLSKGHKKNASHDVEPAHSACGKSGVVADGGGIARLSPPTRISDGAPLKLPLHFSVPLTPNDRASFYTRAYPDYPAVWSDKNWLMGQWNMGNNYQGSGYHGSYPPAYLKRVMVMFPDARRILHVFSGSLGSGRYVRVDLRADACAGVVPDVRGDAELLPLTTGTFDLVLADPPYSQEDANTYGTPMVDRRRAFAECVRVLGQGGHLVWLDMVHPMYRKSELKLWGQIGIVRSTTHRYRIVTFWQRL
jgi:hypothetical protein